MGAGKTRAAARGAPSARDETVDADELIERELGEPIAEAFFEREGEAAFREREAEVVLSLLRAAAAACSRWAAARSSPSGCARPWAGTCRLVSGRRGAPGAGSRDGGRPLAATGPSSRGRFAEREPLYEEARGGDPADRRAGSRRRAAPWLAAMPPAGHADDLGGLGESALSGRRRRRARLIAGAAEAPWRARCPARRSPSPTVRRSPRPRPAPRCEAVIEVEGSEAPKTISEAERVLASWPRRARGATTASSPSAAAWSATSPGFCAATYQRGVPVVQAPTTLVAQVDSAYGGKTGVDLPEAKNYIGAYHLPLAVLADPATLATLPEEELAAGFVEVVKTALIAAAAALGAGARARTRSTRRRWAT